MDPKGYFAASRLLIVAGKGGVGKTVVSAVLARAASMVGRSALVVGLDGRSGPAGSFGRPHPGYEAEVVFEGRDPVAADPDGVGHITARTITPDAALREYLGSHGLAGLSRRLLSAGLLEVAATATPGIRDLLVLGKLAQVQRDCVADVIVVDAPSSGHAITFLRSARGILDAVRAGPLQAQAGDVDEMLRDPARCEVILVTAPEETPVSELLETGAALTADVGVRIGMIVVNGGYAGLPGLDHEPEAAAFEAGVVLPPVESAALAAAATFRRQRIGLQSEQVARLDEMQGPARIVLPHLFTDDGLGPDQIEALAELVLDAVAAMTGPDETGPDRSGRP